MDEKQVANGIRNGDKKVFEFLYQRYYVYLCHIAEHITRDVSDAEEVVSDVFVKLWNHKEFFNISSSLKTYLVKAVQNTSINYLEKTIQKIKPPVSMVSNTI